MLVLNDAIDSMSLCPNSLTLSQHMPIVPTSTMRQAAGGHCSNQTSRRTPSSLDPSVSQSVSQSVILIQWILKRRSSSLLTRVDTSTRRAFAPTWASAACIVTCGVKSAKVSQVQVAASKATRPISQVKASIHSTSRRIIDWTRFDSDRQKAARGFHTHRCAAVQVCRMRCWLAGVQVCTVLYCTVLYGCVRTRQCLRD